MTQQANNLTSLSSAVFTTQVWQTLKEKGYAYLQVMGLTSDGRTDYIATSYILLVPFRQLPGEPNQVGIFEPIGSPIFKKWAQAADKTILVQKKYL
jgi:hypothetical protein